MAQNDLPAVRYASYTFKAAVMAFKGGAWLVSRRKTKIKDFVDDHKRDQISEYKTNSAFRKSLKDAGFTDVGEAALLFEAEGTKLGAEKYPTLLKRSGIGAFANDFLKAVQDRVQEGNANTTNNSFNPNGGMKNGR